MKALLGSMLLLAALPAQDVRSTILGTVTDASGAAVAGATVTITNTGTQERRTAVTTDRGDYEVSSLDVGLYEAAVEMSGFRKEVITGIRLEVGQRARVDAKLSVGDITQQVTVEASAALLQTDDATVGTVIDRAKITELPLPGSRNLYRLALLAPGMSRGPASSVTTSGFGAGFGIAAAGQKVHNNWIVLDGAPLRTVIHGVTRMRPSVEAVEEFRVEYGWYNAEYGTQSGAQIISTIRPGTNQYHGTLFHFLRNEKLDARNFFENPLIPKRPLRRNIFGGVLSGPILKNRTFFTVNFEGFRERRTNQGFAIYPTQRMREGDLTEPNFRNPVSATGALIPIRDLTSGQPFPDNRIPASRIARQAQGFFKYWPTPNFGPAAFDGTNNYSGSSRNALNDDQTFVRIDHQLGSSNKLFGRYGNQEVDDDAFPVNPHPYFVARNPRHQQNAVLNWTRILSPRLLGEVKVAYNRDIFKRVDDVSGTDFNILRDLGIPGQTNNPTDTGLPSLSITGVSGLGNTDINTIWDESRLLAGSLTFTRGSHNWKFGSEFIHLRLDRRTVNFVKGAFTFTGVHSGIGLPAAQQGRLAWADFLLDQPAQVRTGLSVVPGFDSGSYPRAREWRWHNYFTDDWKITPKLTMNYGLRYEYNSVWQDIRGGSRNVDINRGILFPEAGVKADLHAPEYDNFAPRVGFAYRPFGGNNTVIRLGYGVFYNINMANNIVPTLALNPPFSQNINELNAAGNIRIRMATADQAQARQINSEILGVAINYGVGDVQQWNFNIQHALPGRIVFELGYIGSKTSHMDQPVEYNAFLPGTQIRPHPEFGNVEIITLDAAGNYHGLLAKAEKRFSSGLTFLQTYTWSKTFMDSFAGNGAERHNNPYNRRLEKGLAETDQRHRSTSAWLYDLPFYRGRRDLAGQLLGGWQVNGVLVMETGLPMHPTQSLKPVDDGCPRCTHRPDRIRDGRLSGSERTLDRWFDTTAFVQVRDPAANRYGNSGRNILTAPGLVSLDFSIFKNFLLTERKNLQFRWEMYNAANTPPFNPPGLAINTGNFGRITSAGAGREMQVGLRLEF